MSKRSFQKGDFTGKVFSPVLLLSFFVFVFLPLFSQGVEVPELFNYQGLLLDSVGAPLPDGEYGLQFSVHNAEEGGLMIWGPQVCEGVNDPENGLHSKVLVKNGEFHLVLGPKDTYGAEISTAFTQDNAWLEIEVTIDKDGNSVTDGIIKPRQRFLSAPYAFYSRRIPMVDPDEDAKIINVEDGFDIKSSQDGTLRASLIGKEYGGELKCYHTNGAETLALRGGKSGYTGGRFDLRDTNEQNLITMHAMSNGNPEHIMYQKDGHHGIISSVYDNGGIVKCCNSSGAKTVQIWGYGAYGGCINLYNHSGQPLLETSHKASNHYLNFYNIYGKQCVNLIGVHNDWGYIYLKNNEVDNVKIYPGFFELKNSTGVVDMRLYNDPWLDLYNNGDINMYDNNGTRQVHIYTTNGHGYIYANEKHFQIPHPTKPGMVLDHACIEGPELAVFYRGEAQLNGGVAEIALPEYFEALTRKENRTVQLTCKNGWAPIFYEDIINGKFKVKTTDQGNPSQEFSWEVKAVRADVDPLQPEQSEQELKEAESSRRAKRERTSPDVDTQTDHAPEGPTQ